MTLMTCRYEHHGVRFSIEGEYGAVHSAVLTFEAETSEALLGCIEVELDHHPGQFCLVGENSLYVHSDEDQTHDSIAQQVIAGINVATAIGVRL